MIWEVVESAGAIVGLATGAAVLFERMTRGRPVFILASEKSHDSLQGRILRLKAINPNRKPILVSVCLDNRIGRFGIAADEELNSTIAAWVNGTVDVLINGETTEIFPVLLPDNFSDLDEDHFVPLQLKWRFPQAGAWAFWHRVTIGIRKADYDKMSYVWK